MRSLGRKRPMRHARSSPRSAENPPTTPTRRIPPTSISTSVEAASWRSSKARSLVLSASMSGRRVPARSCCEIPGRQQSAGCRQRMRPARVVRPVAGELIAQLPLLELIEHQRFVVGRVVAAGAHHESQAVPQEVLRRALGETDELFQFEFRRRFAVVRGLTREPVPRLALLAECPRGAGHRPRETPQIAVASAIFRRGRPEVARAEGLQRMVGRQPLQVTGRRGVPRAAGEVDEFADEQGRRHRFVVVQITARVGNQQAASGCEQSFEEGEPVLVADIVVAGPAVLVAEELGMEVEWRLEGPPREGAVVHPEQTDHLRRKDLPGREFRHGDAFVQTRCGARRALDEFFEHRAEDGERNRSGGAGQPALLGEVVDESSHRGEFPRRLLVAGAAPGERRRRAGRFAVVLPNPLPSVRPTSSG